MCSRFDQGNTKLQKHGIFVGFNLRHPQTYPHALWTTSKRDALTTPVILRVALDTPLRRLFDYLPARDSQRHDAEPGMRVRVPFGRQRLVGVVHSLAASSDLPTEKLKAVLEVIDAEPVIDAQRDASCSSGPRSTTTTRSAK